MSVAALKRMVVDLERLPPARIVEGMTEPERDLLQSAVWAAYLRATPQKRAETEALVARLHAEADVAAGVDPLS